MSAFVGRHGPLLIAEIGGNHEGDFAAAERLTDLAIASGADVIKFQLYRGDTLVSRVESPDRHRHFQRFELSQAQHLALAARCTAAGKQYLASVWDLQMLDWIDPHLTMYKIGSGDLTAYPLLAEFARRGKPIILSTGLSSLDEVLEAVMLLQSINPIYRDAAQLALLQCTALYPNADRDVHLRAMDTLRLHTGLSVGYSDHTTTDLALFVAAARGAQVLEFHFTESRAEQSFRDHAVSLTCAEVQTLCARLDQLAELLGSAEKVALPREIESGHVSSFRRAVYCTRDLKAGEALQAAELVCLRPNHGVDARQFAAVIGRRVAVDTPAFAALQLIDD